MKKINAFLVASLMSAGAFAGEEKGPYVAFDVGQFTFNGYCDTEDLTSAGIVVSSFACDDSTTSWRASVGIPVNTFLAGEIGYYYSGPASANFGGSYLSVPFSAADQISEKAFQFSVIGTFPVADRLALLGRVGLARWEVRTDGSISVSGIPISLSDSASGVDALFGFGFKYDINEKLALRGMFESHTAGEEATTGRGSVNFLGIGLLLTRHLSISDIMYVWTRKLMHENYLLE